ncbi:MAG: hypothetical protein JKY94_01140 [Rhodobacteraceae bacterium]|nr:hypothetical protein [Paracoccaceae bacterium]
MPSFSDGTPTSIDRLETSDAVAGPMDLAMQRERSKETPRDYLGGSRLGHATHVNPYARGCERALFYEYGHCKKDPGREFDANILRVFDMGHDAEDRLAEYFRFAGFDLRTEKAKGGQFGFQTAPDPDDKNHYRIRGHIDGVFLGGPETLGELFLVYPFLWETKGMKENQFNKFKNKGVELSHPVYFGQLQIYMAYMKLHEHPALFTAINRNTGEIGYELVPFDEKCAQAASDRGLRVVSARAATELPRISSDKTAFACRFCDYKETCWSETEPAQVSDPRETNLPVWVASR